MFQFYHHKSAALYAWFEAFEVTMDRAAPSLNELMLYAGPGLAKAWRERANTPAELAKVKIFESLFSEILPEIVKRVPKRSLNLIDLGIGDCKKGGIALQELLKQDSVDEVHAYPLDASLEMLVLGVSETLDVKWPKLKSVTALHCDLNNVLFPVREVVARSKPSVFFLLGNTLGNLDSDRKTLMRLREAMQAEKDLLLLEVQKIKPLPDEATKREHCEDYKKFYGGPFLAAGAPADAFNVSIEFGQEDEAEGTQQNSVKCSFNRDVTLHHLGFRGSLVEVPRGTVVTVYPVKRYSREGLAKLLNDCGYNPPKIITSDTTDMMLALSTPVEKKKVEPGPCDVLLVSTIPLGQQVPAFDKERNAIQAIGLHVQEFSGTFDQMKKEIRDRNPRVVHFCMHGHADAVQTGVGLLFKDIDGEEDRVSPKDLANCFEDLAYIGKRVDVVVLSVCEGRELAEALGEVVDYVVALPGVKVLDSEAIKFAKSFYGNYSPLGADRACKRAAESGKHVCGRKVPTP